MLPWRESGKLLHLQDERRKEPPKVGCGNESLPVRMEWTAAQIIKKRKTRVANPFVHLELNTPDLPKAKEFYTALFGWQFQDMDMAAPAGIYGTFKPETGPGGGMMT